MPTRFLPDWLERMEQRHLAVRSLRERFHALVADQGGLDRMSYAQQTLAKRTIHLEALIVHNVEALTRVLREMAAEGIPITEEVLKMLSPYRTSQVNRFGDYTLDLKRPVGKQLF